MRGIEDSFTAGHFRNGFISATSLNLQDTRARETARRGLTRSGRLVGAAAADEVRRRRRFILANSCWRIRGAIDGARVVAQIALAPAAIERGGVAGHREFPAKFRCTKRRPLSAASSRSDISGWRDRVLYPFAWGRRERATNLFLAILSDLRLRCIAVDGRSTLPAPSYRVVSASPVPRSLARGLSGVLSLRHFRLARSRSLSLGVGAPRARDESLFSDIERPAATLHCC
jgi:hypothetical protein